MNNNMALEQFDDIKGRINTMKADNIKTELAKYSQCVKALKDAAAKKQDAERKFEKKQTEKNNDAVNEATKNYDKA